MSGERTLTSVHGNSQRLDGGAMFGNAPKALWSRWCAPDERNRIQFACRALLVRDAGRNILFETGIGAFFSPKMKDRFGIVEEQHVLLESLAEQGVQPGDIDIIVLSHLHFDHAGGLLNAYEEGNAPSLAFPNAQIVVGSTAWERAQDPHMRDRASFIPELVPLLSAPRSKGGRRLEIVEGESSDLLGAGFHLHRSSGHTPGMMLAEIEMPGGPVVFVADLVPGIPWVHLPITMGYDRFPEKLIDEKKALLQSLAQRNGRLFYTHDWHCAMSSLAYDERGRFVAKDKLASLVELNH